jgi:cold-inducible RNA-binding protein
LKPERREQPGNSKSSQPKVIMNTKLYVGNLAFDATENELQDLFAPHGPVLEVNLVQDRITGKARGFAFVTMETKEGADAAIQTLSGRDFHGRALTVSEARPREPRTGGGGGGGGGGGYHGGGGGGYGGGRRSNRY